MVHLPDSTSTPPASNVEYHGTQATLNVEKEWMEFTPKKKIMEPEMFLS